MKEEQEQPEEKTGVTIIKFLLAVAAVSYMIYVFAK